MQLKVQSLEETNKQNQAYIKKLESELSQRKGISYLTPFKSYNTLFEEDTSASEYSSKIPIAKPNSPNRSNKSHQLIDELKLRDAKITELENIVLSMKMQNLKLSHQEELKLFKLEDTLHKLNDKLSDVEIINVNLRKHLLISEKIIESRDIKIDKLKASLMEQQSQVLRDGVNFENKLSSIKERLDAYAKQKSNEETKNLPLLLVKMVIVWPIRATTQQDATMMTTTKLTYYLKAPMEKCLVFQSNETYQLHRFHQRWV